MALFLAPVCQGQAIDVNGNPRTGGKIYTYLAGTSTPTATYTTEAGVTPHANPIILNSLGYTPNPIWLTSGLSYKFVETDSADVVIRTIDNIDGVNDTTQTASEWFDSGFAPTYINATSFSVSGDRTSTLQIGRRLKTTNTGGAIYSTITNSVFGAVTTVTVTNDSGTLDAGLSAVAYGLLSVTNPSVPATYVKTGLATASGLTMSTSRILARTTASTGAIEEKTGDEIVGMISTPIPLAKGGTGVAVTRQLAKTSTATRATVGTGTTLIPGDDTIPQITEGDEYLTISFTPTSATSTLRIQASCTAAHTVAGASLAMCLFQDSTANALDVGFATVPVISYCVPLDIDHSMTSGTTSAITFRIRIGSDTAGTTTVNGSGGGRRYGGTSLMRITVDEYLP